MKQITSQLYPELQQEITSLYYKKFQKKRTQFKKLTIKKQEKLFLSYKDYQFFQMLDNYFAHQWQRFI